MKLLVLLLEILHAFTNYNSYILPVMIVAHQANILPTVIGLPTLEVAFMCI